MMNAKLRINSPCKDCKSRYIGCHDECVNYKKYVNKKEEINEISFKERCKESEINNYEVECARRTIRRQGGKNRW